MDPQRWQRVESLFDRALDRPPDERAVFLADACASDLALREEVEALIAADERSSGFIEPPGQEAMSRLLGEEDSMVGSRLGAYRLTGMIGSGGMGRVYLAERTDEQFEQQTAVKVIKRGMDTDEVLRRFRFERQTLARLNHPNIARLLDGGNTEDGRPFLVMEYIKGRPIDEYCNVHRLDTTRRLRLFEAVCEAVQYAHRNLLVHRDLKPGNILVDERGTPKLLDFGIAKLLEPDGRSSLITAPGLRPMTPQYASPEQVRGEPITTATDVYALGVILYELLTGHRPYSFPTRVPREIERIICEQAPEKPSTVIRRMLEVESDAGSGRITLTPEWVSRTRDGHPERLRRRLAGDIDTIVLMAMHKDPARRYSSVEQLAEDIRRHLKGRPVLARKDTWTYRAGKFVKRNKIAVTLASLLGLAVVVGAAGMARSARIANEERNTALMQKQKAEQQSQRADAEARSAKLEASRLNVVNGFLVDTLGSVSPDQDGHDVTVREILDRSAVRIDRAFDDQPEVLVELRTALGRSYQAIGEFEKAEIQLRGALELAESLHGADSVEAAERMGLLAPVLAIRQTHDEAETLFREALAIFRRELGDDDPVVGINLNNLAYFLRTINRFDEAEALLREAIEIERAGAGAYHPSVAAGMANLAWLDWIKGRYDQAESEESGLGKALAIQRHSLGDDHPDVVNTMYLMGSVLRDKGDFARAEGIFREALDLQRRQLGDGHPHVATTLTQLASILRIEGHFDAAEPLFREALEIHRAAMGDDHPHVALTLGNLAYLLAVQSRFEESEQSYRESLAILDQGDESWQSATTKAQFAGLLRLMDQHAEAEALCSAALDTQRRLLGEDHPLVAITLNNLAMILLDQGEPEVAEELIREALDIQGRTLRRQHHHVAISLNNLALALTAEGRYAQAEASCREALEIRQDLFGEPHPDVTDSVITLAFIWMSAGQPEKAEPVLREYLDQPPSAYPAWQWPMTKVRSLLAQCLTDLGRLEEAEKVLGEE